MTSIKLSTFMTLFNAKKTEDEKVDLIQKYIKK